MAKKLGIDINIDFGKAISQIDKLETKLQSLEKDERKIKVDVDTGSITKAMNSLNKVFGGKGSKQLKLDVDTKPAMKSIESFVKRYNEIKKSIENYGEIKVDPTAKRDNKSTKVTNDSAQSLAKEQDALNIVNQQIKEKAQNYRTLLKLKKEQVSLEDKAYKAQQKVGTSKISEEAHELTKIVASREEKIAAIEKEISLSGGLTSKQKEELALVKQQAEEQRRLTQAKQNDAQLASKQKANYNELKAQLKEIHNLNKQIIQLEARESNSPLSQKEEAKLQALKQQKSMIEQNHQAKLQELAADEKILSIEKEIANIKKRDANGDASNDEKEVLATLEKELAARKDNISLLSQQAAKNQELTNDQAEQLSAIKRTQTANEDMVKSAAELASKAEKSEAAYKDLESVLRNIDKLYDQMSNSGENQAREINKVVKAEERRAEAIKDSIRQQGLLNQKSEQNISKIEEASAEQRAYARNISKGKQQDNNEMSGMWGQMFNPANVAREAKQAFDIVLDSVATIDKELVDIAKVADVSDEVMNKFSDGLYDQASKVGKAADEYAGSVARWLTTGRTLQESDALSQVSVMGSFVGNIDEEEMVKYMAVPLEVYKKDMLEAEDIVNAMNEVANNHAVEMDDLGAAYSRAANTASNAGTSFSELSGLIAGANVMTRAGGEKIGTALKTMDLTVSQIGVGATKGFQDKQNFLNDIGVRVLDENGELKSTYQVLSDLAGVWDKLNSKQQGLATTYIAGKNHAPILQGIVNGWDHVVAATGDAETQVSLFNKESGSAFEEFEKQQDSVEFKVAAMKNAWAEFLNALSGGKDGVNSVLDIVTMLFEKLTNLAKNDELREMALNLGKVFLAMVAMKGVSNVFKFMTAGVKPLWGAIKLLTKGFGSLFSSGTAATMSKTLGFFTKGGAGASGLIAGFSKFIPIVGGVITALTLLEASGVPVFDTLGKAAETFFDFFKSDAQKAKDYYEGFISDIEKTGEKLDSNKLLNGETDGVEHLVESYEALVKKKEEAYEKGDVNALRFSEDEFTSIQKNFNDMAENLGLDIKITMNDYDDIAEKYAQLQKMANQLRSSELKKGTEDAMGLRKDYDFTDAKKAVEDKLKSSGPWDQGLDREIEAAESFLKNASQGDMGDVWAWKNTPYDELPERIQKGIDKLKELRKEEEELSNFWSTSEARDAHKGDEARFAEQKEYMSNMANQIKQGHVSREAWAVLSKEEQDYNLSGVLAAGKTWKDDAKSYSDAAKVVQKAQENLEKAAKNPNDKNNKKALIDDETLEILKGIDPSFTDKTGTNWGTWVDAQHKKYDETGEFTTADDIIKKLEEKASGANKNVEELKANMAGLAAEAGWSDATFEKAFQAIEAGGQEYVSFMSGLGDFGADALQVGSIFKACAEEAGVSWQTMVIGIQKDLDGLTKSDREVAIKVGLADEGGTVNAQKIEEIMMLPESVQVGFDLIDEGGNVEIQNTLEFLEQLDGKKSQSTFLASCEVEGQVDLDLFSEKWKELEEDERDEILKELGLEVNDNGAFEDINFAMKDLKNLSAEEINFVVGAINETGGPVDEAKTKLAEVENDYTAYLEANQDGADASISDVVEKLVAYNLLVGTAELDADDQKALQKYMEAHGVVIQFDKETGTASFCGDASQFNSVADGVEKRIANKTVWVTYEGALGSSLAALEAKYGGGSSGSYGGGKKSAHYNAGQSVAITHPNMASSFSRSVTEDAGASTASATSYSTSTKGGNPRYNTDNAKVESDVWRYWSKELFKGLPLERTMENLENSITKAADNNDKLISLYRQQIKLLGKQVNYQKEMKSATQSEMNSVLKDLRKKGFKTSGNKVTNLGHAKSFKGDAVSDVQTLLDKWKSLYEGLDDITGKINSLNLEKWEIEKDIRDIKEEIKLTKETEKIEKALKKSNALLTMIENHTSIANTKQGLISDSDKTLKLAVNEEAMNTAKKSMSSLIDEFNKMSKTSVQFEANGEDISSQLESIKSQILENADAIIQYREEMNQLRIDRLIEDYDKFADTMDRNNDKLASNIETLKEGLLSGTKFGDLKNSSLNKLTFQSKDKLTSEYQKRLSLEADLDKALEAYAKKNVDRQKNVANSQLKIEKKKYTEMLKMQGQYSNGKAVTMNAIKGGYNIGLTAVSGSKSDTKAYKQWLNQITKVNNEYYTAYAKLQQKFDKENAKAKTVAQKEKLSNQLIIDQLKLQVKLNQQIVKSNDAIVKKINQELKNSQLTTDQREQLLEQLQTYEDSSIAAQDKIREAIRSRYEFEYSLMEKNQEKAQKSTEELEHLLDVATLAGFSSDKQGKIIDKIFTSTKKEYDVAQKSLNSLIKTQKGFAQGSFEWNILQEQIDEVRDSMKDLTVSMLEANKNVLDGKIDKLSDSFAKGAFDGKTLEEWEDYHDSWMTGVEKELELEKLRQRMIDSESDLNKERLEILDKQDAVSKKEVEYMQKQMDVLELQQKLANIENEREVQVLQKREDGSWDWGYVADQSKIDEVRDDLKEAEKDLEIFEREQKGEYVSGMQEILDNVKDGKYESTADVFEAIKNLQSLYAGIVGDMPGFNSSDVTEILKAYQSYLDTNKSILNTVSTGDKEFGDKLKQVGLVFQDSFKVVLGDFSKTLAKNLKDILSTTTNVPQQNTSKSYVIQSQELYFPNVTDAAGLEEAFLSLPDVVNQQIMNK